MPPRITEEEFLRRFNNLYKDKLEYISGYKTMNRSKINIKCKMCGYEFVKNPTFLLGYGNHLPEGCPKCSKKIAAQKRSISNTKSFDDFIKDFNRVSNSEYEYISGYKDSYHDIKIKHLKCGRTYLVRANNFISNHRKCPLCNIDRIIKERSFSKEKFLKIFKEKLGNEYTYLSGYTTMSNKIKVRHNKCGRIFWINAISLTSRYRSCTCYKIGSSDMEHQLQEFIRSIYKGKILLNKKIDNKYELDIYLPKLKLAIEFNGLYWHSNKFIDKDKHLNKLNYINKKEIYLIQIFEDEWLYNKNFVLNLIKSYVIKDKIEIEIKNINYIDKYNKVELYDKNKLIASLDYYINNKNVIIKNLYFNYRYNNCILLKTFIRILENYNKDIIYKADLCHYNFSLDNIFIKNNFKKIDFISPKFKYIATNTDDKHRFNKKEIIKYKKSRKDKNIKEAKVYNAGYIIYCYKVD